MIEAYKETLEYIIETIAKSYTVILSVNLVALIACVLLKNKYNLKKIRVLLIVILICASFCFTLVLVPRVVDLQQSNYITIEDAKLVVDETNVLKNSGSIMFYGIADAFPKEGKSIKVLGVNFFELSQNPKEEYYGDIVYAKYSRQLIAVK
ncbi:MAG: hypothetical protein IKI97_07290 [Clostridia bacterium]|nr:hypothetical protein [Clostridia bacterium]